MKIRAVVQRVRQCSVTIGGSEHSSIGEGLLVLLGVAKGDGETEAGYIAGKILNLRIFPDGEGRMNRSVIEAGGSIMAVSQFTLLGDCGKGRRPSYAHAEDPGPASALIDRLVGILRASGLNVETGVFGEMMMVSLDNWGPVTLVIDSKQ